MRPARFAAPNRALMAVLLLAVNTLPALLIYWAATLRETPLFWRNAGGYPVEFRETVRVGFPVFLLGDLVLVGAAVATVLRFRSAFPRLARTGVAIALLQGLLLGAAVERAVRNNLSNVWNGRPLHWKPPP